INEGFNLDSDGQYRKAVTTEDPYLLEYSNGFKALNAILDATRAIANPINELHNQKQEKEKLLKARYMTSQHNPYENGLNNVPVFTKTGGDVSVEKAKKILKD